MVPELRIVMKNAMERLTGKSFLAVGTGIKTGLDIRTDNPAQLGADLVVDAVAALAKYKPPLVIFDMGTATTLSVVDRRAATWGHDYPRPAPFRGRPQRPCRPAAIHPPGRAGTADRHQHGGLHAERARFTAMPPCWTA